MVEDINYYGGSDALEKLRHQIVDVLGVKNFKYVYDDSKQDNGKVKGEKIDWSKLEGGDLDIILKGLDLDAVLPGKHAALLRSLWDVYTEIITHIRSWDRSCSDGHFADLCAKFRELYIHSGTPLTGKFKNMTLKQLKKHPDYCKGTYRTKDVTPYMHVLMFHLAGLYQRYNGNLMQFSCYALEHSNHFHTKIFFRATTHNGGNTKKENFLKSLFRKLLRILYNPMANRKKALQCEHCYKSYDSEYWYKIHKLKYHEQYVIEDENEQYPSDSDND
jgi:hypothetical protein